MYEVKNVSRGPIHENLDTKDKHMKVEALHLGPQKSKQLTEKQWASRAVQKHITRGRRRSKKV